MVGRAAMAVWVPIPVFWVGVPVVQAEMVVTAVLTVWVVTGVVVAIRA